MCNPNNGTGIFECTTGGSNGSNTPRQCASGFEMYHEDCLNGTVFASFTTSSVWEDAEADCCEHCTQAGAQCAGWNLGPKHQVENAGDRRTCDLLQGKTADWRGAQATHDCKAAVRDPRAFACWYSNPAYNVSFSSVCDPTQCVCDAISSESVGREEHAMCWHHSNASSATMQLHQDFTDDHHSKWFQYITSFACFLDGTWYSTTGKGQCNGSVVEDHCWWRLAETHRTVNSTCVDDRVATSVQKRRPQCWEGCPQPSNRTSACYLDCLFETILGNATLGIPPLTKDQVVAPFAEAFKSDAEGGCPEVVCRSDADCRLSGDSAAHCKGTGWCHCDDGFSGQFCSRSASPAYMV